MPENDGGQSSSKPSASLALWAEDNDIPVEDLARAYHLPLNATKLPTTTPEADADLGLAPESGTKTEVGKYIALDCEMVGVGEGDRESSALARVSIVNFHGHCVLDCFVKPKERVTDWRTWVSGVSPKDMVNAITFEEAQQKASELLNGRILVGHAIKNDLECLLIGHPRRDIRDTSRHPAFRKYSNGRTPALKKLANEILGIEIQGGSHSSIEDARACMLLYRRFKDDFERENQIRFPSHTKKSGGKKKRNKK
ncbi:ribonuclease H-like domain-containing protein [Sphaerosporella brunnea]|uniref:RNA exonuclease 4 n=1 Tax=Sphaerosporella brunnea TaxID=1250544 RepID=A0A5J5EZL8_9PEZI|nr:ribonuclease H-like domain-containing protein [Sphaerosporella brunnea]